MTAAIQRAFAVWFATTSRWDVKGYTSQLAGSFPFVALRDLVRERSERVNLFDFPDTEFRILGVSNDGGIFHAYDALGGTIHQPYKKVEAGDFFYNPYRVNVGSIGIVPKELGGGFASPAYIVFSVDQGRILPQLLAIILKAKWFNPTLRAATAGSVRQNLTFDLLETLKVPLPLLSTQRAILAEWQKARKAIVEAEENARKIEAEIDAQFFADLGLRAPVVRTMPKAFAVQWAEFLRWSVGYNQTALTCMALTCGQFPVVALGSVLDLVQYGTSEKANTSVQGVPVVRMNNIVDGMLNLNNLKHVELRDGERQKLTLCDGDILFNRTNSKELVGKCAVFHAAGEYVFASYLIRIRAQPQRADPDYIAYALNAAIGRQQIDAMSRQIIGQANINSQELRSLMIPLPPLAVQRRIMEKVAVGRARIVRERETARALSAQIEADMQAYLLGTRKVTGGA